MPPPTLEAMKIFDGQSKIIKKTGLSHVKFIRFSCEIGSTNHSVDLICDRGTEFLKT